MKHILSALGVMAGLTLGSATMASVTDVDVTPDPIRVNTQGTALVTVRWIVDVSQSSTNSPVRSNEGVLRIDGTIVETPGGVLSRNVTQLGAFTFRFTERIRISRGVAQLIASSSSVTYEREFTDDEASETASATVVVSGLGELSLQDATLRFDDDSRYRVVARGERLLARARLTTAGRGIFDGSWEVAGPRGIASTSFRPIDRVRRGLAGSRETVFESPALPTDRPGLYFVRLVPGPTAARDTADTFPTLRYFVTPDAGPGAISLISPRAGAGVTPSTRFAWQPEAGASRYRIEFLGVGGIGSGGERRVAAMDVPGGKTQAQLRPFTVERVAREGGRLWRVLAFDGEGRLIAASPLRDIGGGTRLNND